MDLGGLEVAFAEVAEDSRCPPMVTCVWPGRATIRLLLRRDGERAEALPSLWGLSTDGTPAEALGYRFSLRALRPYPSAGKARPPVEERPPVEATLLVESLDA